MEMTKDAQLRVERDVAIVARTIALQRCAEAEVERDVFAARHAQCRTLVQSLVEELKDFPGLLEDEQSLRSLVTRLCEHLEVTTEF